MRPWLGADSLQRLNAAAEAAGIRTESGKPVRFAPPAASDPYYEVGVYETGRVATRPANRHDWFNALAWLAFPRTKARINAMHAAALPKERGRRGRLRDLLTIFDEGGAIVACADPVLVELLRAHEWKALFWENRTRVLASMEIVVLGHAVMEMALAPWAGIACKALVLPSADDLDGQVAAWLRDLPEDATPRALAAIPVFGYPGWMPESAAAGFYDDARYFRPLRA